jgi:hypothetical protein
MYVEEQRRKAEEEKRQSQEAEEKRSHETPETWEHYKARCEEANRHATEADVGGTTSKTWPPPQSSLGNFPLVTFTKSYNSLRVLLLYFSYYSFH